jgi:DNA-binding NtrC family response regulator
MGGGPEGLIQAMRGSVLIVESDKRTRSQLAKILTDAGIEVLGAGDPETALRLLAAEHFDVVSVGDDVAPDSPVDLVRRVRSTLQRPAVIRVASDPQLDDVVAAVRAGVCGYILKPLRAEDVLPRIQRQLEAELDHDGKAAPSPTLGELVGDSPPLRKVIELAERIMTSGDSTVLIQGESGTGKDLLAKLIHCGGPRRDGPYVNVSCTALPDTLLESELFGHEKGAFTDAKALKKGLVELADGGTLFLDEVGDMNLALQSRVLRLLEEKIYRRVGGQRDLRVDTRIVAATNRNLRELTENGEFREDLYFRLNVIPITMPPLRERTGDVQLLVRHFIDCFNRKLGKRVRDVSPELMARLERHSWPGNVRELRNTVERAMVLADGDVLSSELLMGEPEEETSADVVFRLPPEGVELEAVEKDFLLQALRRAGGNQLRAGKLLGLNRDQVRYRMLKYGLHVPQKLNEAVALRGA